MPVEYQAAAIQLEKISVTPPVRNPLRFLCS